MDISNLTGHVPDPVLAELPSVMAKFNIDTPVEVAHFLGQCCVESGNWLKVEESLYYKNAERLLAIFPSAFKNEADKMAKAKTLLCNSEALGDFVYAAIGGYKFRGRGYIQLTGKANYHAFQKAVEDDIMTNPNLVATKYPLLSAGYYFGKYSIGKCIDVSYAAIRAVTGTINKGYVDLDKRKERTEYYYNILTQ